MPTSDSFGVVFDGAPLEVAAAALKRRRSAATRLGPNPGAVEPARAEAAVWRIGWTNSVFTLAVSLISFFLHDALMAQCTDDVAVIAIDGEWLSILPCSCFVYGWWMVSMLAFNGAGDTATPTWIIRVCLSAAHSGVFRGVFISETAAGACAQWFRRPHR